MRNPWDRSRSVRQLLLPFAERKKRLESVFRRAIVLATLLGLVAIWLLMADARSALVGKARQARWSVLRSFGVEPDRLEVDDYWADRRARREVRTRDAYREGFQRLKPDQQTLLKIAGLGPEDAVVRWGNYDLTLVFSSKVFERDENRYYRFRPNTCSIVIKFLEINFLGLETCEFYIPDTPEIRQRIAEAGSAISVDASLSTNSWGCRGPEPDLQAPVRGLVLGDSFMQGHLLADDETPPVCLQRDLQSELGVPTTILNTAILGYSPEHYFHTLQAFGDRFRPQFVVVAVYANDFGDEADVVLGRADWLEGKYWFQQILDYCLARQILCVIAPVPAERQLIDSGHLGNYPGQLSNITSIASDLYCDPFNEFVTENLRLNLSVNHKGKVTKSLLYNGHLNDGHLSPRGAELYARIVSRRLAMLLRGRKLVVSKSSGP